MFDLFKRLWKNNNDEMPPSLAPNSEPPEGTVWRTAHGAALDIDSIPSAQQEKLFAELAAHNNTEVFVGDVRHGYSKMSARAVEICPRCGAATRLYSAHFIYATDCGMRAMLAPAGHFCTRCPTVVVDEQIIAGGVRSEFKYEGVVGIDFLGKREPAVFETWNGRKPVYVFDEDQQCHGMGFGDLPLAHPSGRQLPRSAARKKKQRRRMANQSRRRNR